MGTGLIKKYMYFDVDFEDAEVVVKQLNDAIQQIQTNHYMMGVSDRSIKVSVDSINKRLSLMYYDVVE